jgi:hypothetical protein
VVALAVMLASGIVAARYEAQLGHMAREMAEGTRSPGAAGGRAPHAARRHSSCCADPASAGDRAALTRRAPRRWRAVIWNDKPAATC